MDPGLRRGEAPPPLTLPAAWPRSGKAGPNSSPAGAAGGRRWQQTSDPPPEKPTLGSEQSSRPAQGERGGGSLEGSQAFPPGLPPGAAGKVPPLPSSGHWQGRFLAAVPAGKRRRRKGGLLGGHPEAPPDSQACALASQLRLVASPSPSPGGARDHHADSSPAREAQGETGRPTHAVQPLSPTPSADDGMGGPSLVVLCPAAGGRRRQQQQQEDGPVFPSPGVVGGNLTPPP